MKLRELLSKLKEVQQKIGSSEPFLCGGTPRDRYLGHLENIADIDITTGDGTVEYLSQEFEIELRKQYNVTRTTAADGHSTVYLGTFKMDFSSNFNVPNIEEILLKKGIKKPTSIQKEMFSRDFTCNALLLSLDLKNLLDPTHQGFKDIKEKTIRTCLSPEITLTTNKNRVIRSIYLAAKLNFDIDPEIIAFVKKNPQSVKISTDKVLSEKLNEAFKRDADRASYLITEMGLWNYLPITEIVQPYYMKHTNTSILNNKQAYFQGGGGVNEPTPKKPKYKAEKAIVVQPRFEEPFYHNYDLYDTEGVNGSPRHGPGAGYHHVNNFKSIKEFLDHQRKRLKGKYVANDSYITEENRKERANKMKIRADQIDVLIKLALDFPSDEQTSPILGDSESFETPIKLGPSSPDDTTISPGQVNLGDSESYPASAQIGGWMDKYLSQNDPDDKPESTLDFGYDLNDEPPIGRSYSDLEQLEKKYLEPSPNHGLYGLPDGVDLPDEDLGDPTDLNPDYGTVGPESLMYEDKWNI